MKTAVSITALFLCALAAYPQSTTVGPTTITGQFQINPAQNSPATVQLSPITLSFPAQNVGTSSGAQNVTLKNIGGQVLAVTGVSFGGTNPADFAASNGCTTLNPSATCTISVTFAPQAAGAR